ncbi:hypothetical protein [Deinococcus aquatilis]|uniref:hypothetical protein n=1 Tax=Deinococcus aquatilis TaxID=519440 RepID=UPI000367AF33|nr:hypothetical protein [Deinococcus aquatilis]
MLEHRPVPAFLSVWRLALLDVRGRLRAPGALLAVGLMVALAALYLPEHTAPYVTLSVNGARGVYASAWVGVTVALLGTFAFPLVGFLLVRAALETERRWGAERWTGAAPLPTFWQLLAKTGSHFAFLALLAGVVALSAPWIQWIRGEDRTLDWAALLLPSALLTLPTLFLVAALAVSFGQLPRLRGQLGTGLFLLLWSLAALAALQPLGFPDPLGAGPVLRQVLAASAGSAGPEQLTLGLTPAALPPRFEWSGVSWTAGDLLGRGLWLLLALGLLAAVGRWQQRLPEVTVPQTTRSGKVSLQRFRRVLPPLDSAQAPLWGELRVALRSLHPATALLLGLLSVGGAAAPHLLLPVILLALLPVCSALVTAPFRWGLTPLLASLPQGGRHLLGIRWQALATLTLLCTGPALLSTIMRGEPGAAWGLLVFPVFLPVLALGTAALTRGSTLFEALWIALWYLGPVSGWAGLDYTRLPVALGALTFSLILMTVTWMWKTPPQGGLT